jgi:DNA-binding transcriptional LysR family regulator
MIAMDAKTDHLVRKLRLRHLELLVALADVSTMRGAAARLHLSQPAISKMLGEVEECFGARLFERGHQGIHANALGHGAIYRARAVLHELARATEDVDAMRGGATAVLRVGAPSVTATVPAAITRLRARLPGTAVHVREGRVQELFQRLLDGELDCVFGAITPQLQSGDLLPRVRPEVVLDDALCVLAAQANGLCARRRLRWAELRGAAWVVPPRETLVRQAFMTAFLNDGVTPPEPVVEAMSSVTVGAVLRLDATLLCAVRREQAVDEIARGGVRQLAVEPAIALPSFGLFTRSERVEQPAVLQAFVQAVREVGARAAPGAQMAQRRARVSRAA